MESLLSFFRMHWDHEPDMRKLFISKESILRFMESPLSLFRMHWDHEPVWAIQSAAGPAHSKTWRKFQRLWPTRQRLGVRRSSAAFDGSARSKLVRFMESLDDC